MMWARILEHKMIVLAVLLLGGLIVFATQQKPSQLDIAAQESFVHTDSDSPMSRGSADAPVSIIQYSDFLCPSCSYFSTEIMPSIDTKFIDTGKVKFEFRPMAFIAPGSTQTGAGAYCAIDQEKFWPYHDVIYEFVADKVLKERLDPKAQTILTPTIIEQLAGKAGLDSKLFHACLSSNKHEQDIIDATNLANKNGVSSTPYIMIDGQKYQGNLSLEAVEALIKSKL